MNHSIEAGSGGRGGDLRLITGDADHGCLDLSLVVEKLRAGLVLAADGDVVLASGTPTGDGKAGSIIFRIGDTEVLRIDPDGVFRAGDRVIDQDKELRVLFRGFLGHAMGAMNVARAKDLRIQELEQEVMRLKRDGAAP